MKKIITKNVKETQLFAKSVAREIIKKNKLKAIIIALKGDLGSGKTIFAQGFAKELKIIEPVLSPTFIIFKKFQFQLNNFDHLYHFDLYRIKDSEELGVLEFQGIINNPKNIVLIEWAEKIKNILPPETIFIDIQSINNETRKISISGLDSLLLI